jgi:hypothetical protein
MSLFCPICGTPLIERHSLRGSYLYCPKGGMGLAPVLRSIFEARHVTREKPPSQRSFDWQLHGHLHKWYCPGCGVHLGEHGDCPICGHNLRGDSHLLIETHVHQPVPPAPDSQAGPES